MSSVIGNKRSELHFIEIGGITSLIFAFEKVPRSLKRICCSILIELMTNKKSIEYYNDYVSPLNGDRSTVIFLKTFIEEEERLGVKYHHGILTNDKRPLLPSKELINDLQGGIGGAATSINSLELSSEKFNKLQMIIKSHKTNNNENQDTKLLNKIILDQIDNINDNAHTISDRSEE